MYDKTYSKKELEEMFSISKNTVYDTLKACGLDTGKTRYTEEEIQTRFAPARTLLESGQATYATLKDHFSMRSAQATPDPAETPQTPPPPREARNDSPVESGQFLEAIHEEIEQSFEVMVEAAVFDVIQRLPEIAMRAANSARHRGELRRVFDKARQEFINSPPSFQQTGSRGALQEASVEPEESQAPDVLVDWEAQEDETMQGEDSDSHQSESDERQDDPATST